MRYKCSICGYIYDDEKEKVPFDKLPSDWRCPLCGASKSDFVKVEEEKKVEQNINSVKVDEVKLTINELSALFSNLARGSEKQYKNEDMELFKKLSIYFDGIAKPEDNANVVSLTNLLKEDIEYNYNMLTNVGNQEGDRGALRVCVWGSKVSNMISSLLKRYQEEGDNMLKDNDIWVCTVCGFIFIGKEPPKLCPVCKVPDWKFEKIEGRE